MLYPKETLVMTETPCLGMEQGPAAMSSKTDQRCPCTPHPLALGLSWKAWVLASGCGLEKTRVTCRLIILGSWDWIHFLDPEWLTWKPTLPSGFMVTYSPVRPHPETLTSLVSHKELMRAASDWHHHHCRFVVFEDFWVRVTGPSLNWPEEVKDFNACITVKFQIGADIRAYRASNDIVSTLLGSFSNCQLFLSGDWPHSPFDDRFLTSQGSG